MYNEVCGNNPLFGLFLRILETEGVLLISRFRDAYTRIIDGHLEIVIYTRTGGGNRAEYAEADANLRMHPCYLTDFDDNSDSTFAHYVFRCPEVYEDRMLKLHRIMSRHPKGLLPREKMNIVLGKMEAPSELTSTDLDLLSFIGGALMSELPKPSALEIAMRGHVKFKWPTI